MSKAVCPGQAVRNDPATSIECPTCGEHVPMGLPRNTTVRVVRDTPIQLTIGVSDAKTRIVRCSSGHDAYVTFCTADGATTRP
jgi:hypothetical protein